MGRVAWVVAALLLVPVALAGCSATSDSMQASASGTSGASGGVAGEGAYGSSGSAMAQSGGGRDGKGAVDAYGRVIPKQYVAVVSLNDIHFDFDSYDIRPDAARVLEDSAAWLKSNPTHLVLIEGHADERGTNEYNIALGDRRARAAMNYLVSHGVQSRRVSRISYGEERAVCGDRTEDCWAKNRRAHFSVKAQ